MNMNFLGGIGRGIADTGMALDRQHLERDQLDSANRRADAAETRAQADWDERQGAKAKRQAVLKDYLDTSKTFQDVSSAVHNGDLDVPTANDTLMHLYNTRHLDGYNMARGRDGNIYVLPQGSMRPEDAVHVMNDNEAYKQLTSPQAAFAHQDNVIQQLVSAGDMEGAQALQSQFNNQFSRLVQQHSMAAQDRGLGLQERKLTDVDIPAQQAQERYQQGELDVARGRNALMGKYYSSLSESRDKPVTLYVSKVVNGKVVKEPRLVQRGTNGTWVDAFTNQSIDPSALSMEGNTQDPYSALEQGGVDAILGAVKSGNVAPDQLGGAIRGWKGNVNAMRADGGDPRSAGKMVFSTLTGTNNAGGNSQPAVAQPGGRTTGVKPQKPQNINDLFSRLAIGDDSLTLDDLDRIDRSNATQQERLISAGLRSRLMSQQKPTSLYGNPDYVPFDSYNFGGN